MPSLFFEIMSAPLVSPTSLHLGPIKSNLHALNLVTPPPPPQTIRHSKSKNEASCTCEGEEHASRPQQIVAALSEGEDDAQGSQDHE